VTVTHRGGTVCTERVDLADATARKQLLRKIRKGRLILPEGMLGALASALQAPAVTALAENPLAPYRRTDEGFWLVRTKGGTVEDQRLSNFTAVIKTERLDDDGHEVHRIYEMEVHLGDRVERPEVSASEFDTLGWVRTKLPASAIIEAGNGTRDHLRVAIQKFSGMVPERRVFAHTGWRDVDGSPVYLHAGGAIGPTAHLVAPGSVRLPEALRDFCLPDPPEGAELEEAVRATLRLLDLGPDHITIPLGAAPFRAVLGPCDFSVHVHGKTGVFKTELAALKQQHFGRALGARNLPGSWMSTANFSSALLHAAKDALFVIDDFVLTGSQSDVQRAQRDADRLFRGQGNNAGRGRMRADTTTRPPMRPRGLPLSTGEETPAGLSLGARILAIHVGPGDIDKQKLTLCQTDAASGLYAGTMAAFLSWVSHRYDEVVGSLPEQVRAMRGKIDASGHHLRTPEIIANLAVGFQWLCTFAQEIGVLDGISAGQLMWGRGWSALLRAADDQRQLQENEEPVVCFLALLRSALTSGQAHVAAMNGGAPNPPDPWGWRNGSTPTGRKIGWLDRANLYLQPEAAYQIACEVAQRSGQPFTMRPTTLSRALSESRLLLTEEHQRNVHTVRVTVEGSRQPVLHLAASTVVEADGLPPQGSSAPAAPGAACPIAGFDD
jgi:hypothetical protein